MVSVNPYENNIKFFGIALKFGTASWLLALLNTGLFAAFNTFCLSLQILELNNLISIISQKYFGHTKEKKKVFTQNLSRSDNRR